MRRRAVLIFSLTALSLVIAGCSGSMSREEFASDFVEATTGESSPFTEEQASCLGGKIYDTVGTDQLDERLEDSETFPKELVGPLAKAGPECAAAGDVLREQLSVSGITPEQTDCIVEAINDDAALNQQVWDDLAASAAGDVANAEASADALTDVATICIDG